VCVFFFYLTLREVKSLAKGHIDVKRQS